MLQSRKTLRSLAELAEAGLVSAADLLALSPVAARYAVAITPAMTKLIDPNDPNDPIARQFVPTVDELHTRPEESADPIGDEAHSPVPGIVHRYKDRVLLKLTQICPVYCRFCFRREMVGPGKDAMLDETALERAFAYIAAHPEIWEVILTGGDPFVLAPRRLAEITARLSAIEHARVLRWHTRVPVVDPDAVTAELVEAIHAGDQAVYIVLHANHPRELTAAARAACRRLARGGISLLSQSVLLKGVNDDAATLRALMRALVEAGVKPYYLHHTDLAPGTEHFRTAVAEGQALMRTLHASASGLCQPGYVLDIPGGYAKAKLDLSDWDEAGQRARDGDGVWHPHNPSREA